MLFKAPSREANHIGLLAGVDSEHHQMLFMAPSREAKRQVRVPMSALQHGRLTLRTDLVDVYLYIFTKQTVFAVLEARPSCQSIKQVYAALGLIWHINCHSIKQVCSTGSDLSHQLSKYKAGVQHGV